MNECVRFSLILKISVIQSLMALFNEVPSAPVEKLSFKIKLAPQHLLIYYSWGLPAIHYHEFFLEAIVNTSRYQLRSSSHYSASNCYFLPMFRVNRSVSVGCPETS